MDLTGHTIVVTGGSPGIGRSSALTAVERGADVVVADLQQEPRRDVPPTVEAVRNRGTRSEYVEADVTSPQDLQAVAEVAAERENKFDAWVNNTGYAETYDLRNTSAENWKRSLKTNLTGTLNRCRVAAEHMLERGGGSIVSIAGGAGVVGFVNSASYTATKGGVIALIYQIAVDFAADDLRVNAVSPGFIDTEMLQQDTQKGLRSTRNRKHR